MKIYAEFHSWKDQGFLNDWPLVDEIELYTKKGRDVRTVIKPNVIYTPKDVPNDQVLLHWHLVYSTDLD